jgi:hypothetical protein
MRTVSGGQQDSVHSITVKQAAPHLRAEFDGGSVRLQRSSMRSRLGQRVVDVGSRENSITRSEDISGQPVGISRSVKAFVMSRRYLTDLGECGDLGKHAVGQIRMESDALELRPDEWP